MSSLFPQNYQKAEILVMAIFHVIKNYGYTVMSNYHLRDKRLSLKAKGLLSQMLSLPENWDYSLKGLTVINRENIDAIRTAVVELENAGYITRRQGRDDKGKMTGNEYNIYEKPMTDKPLLENPTTAKPIAENPMQLIKEVAIKEKINTEDIKYPSIHQDRFLSNQNAMDSIEIYRSILHDNIEYDILCQQEDKELLDEIVEIRLECICSSKETICIGKEDIPKEVVKSRFLKINSEHIEYILFCMKRNTTKVRNIKAYLKSVIYNAPITINSFYSAEVNHDLYGG